MKRILGISSKCKWTNHMSLLYDDHGNPCSEEAGMGSVLLSYFSNLFSNSHHANFDQFHSFPALVSADNNDFLLALFRLEEFRTAVFDMHLDKSLGSDGMNLAFFQKD